MIVATQNELVRRASSLSLIPALMANTHPLESSPAPRPSISLIVAGVPRALTAERPSKTWFVPFLGVWLMLAIVSLNTHINLGSDEDLYLVLGRSIAKAHSYSYAHFVDQPLHKRLPPLYPLLLSPLMHLPLSAAVVGAKLLNSLAAAALLFFLARRGGEICRGFDQSVWLALIGSYWLMHFSHLVLSETIYSLLSLFALKALTDQESSGSRKYALIFTSAVWLLAAYFIRSVGVALCLGYGAHYLLHRKEPFAKKNLLPVAMLAIIIAVPVVLWAWRGAMIPTVTASGSSYLDQFTDRGRLTLSHFVVRTGYNAVTLVMAFGSLILSSKPHEIGDFSRHGLLLLSMDFGVSICVVTGYFRGLSKRQTIADYYVAFYLLIIVLWIPWNPVRFCLPIAPWLFAYFLEGVGAIGAATRFRWAASAKPAMACLLFVLGTATVTLHFVPREFRRKWTQDEQDFMQATRELAGTNSPPDAIISDLPHAVSFQTETKNAYFPDNPSSSPSLLDYSKRFEHLYFVIDPWMTDDRRRDVYTEINAIPGSSSMPIKTEGKTLIYRQP